MKEKKEYNLEIEGYDMELGKAYDIAIRDSIQTPLKFLEVKDGVYFGEEYRAALKESLVANELYDTFKKEINSPQPYPKDKPTQMRYKMCSVASSSRLCYLNFKSLNAEFEQIINNQGCHPNFDAHLNEYNGNKNVYIECKCHEIVNSWSLRMAADPYQKLLEDYFGIHYDSFPDKNKKLWIKVGFKEFLGVETINGVSCGKYFDFKQFLCHVIGLLGLKRERPTLQYVFFEPNKKFFIEENQDLFEWKDQFDPFVKELFEKFRNIKIKRKKLMDYINLPNPIVIDVLDVSDDTI